MNRWRLILAVGMASLLRADEPDRDAPRVVSDETFATTTLAENNTSPAWAVGAPMLVRTGNAVWASLAVHDAAGEPYCNTHWELWRKPDGGSWSRVRQGDPASEREPCPIFLPAADTLAVSIHPRLLARDRDSAGRITAFCQPAVAQFDLPQPGRPRLVRPPFPDAAVFGEHSYRGVAADPRSGRTLLAVMDRSDRYHLLRRQGGDWHPTTLPSFPVRACYPNLAISGPSAHFFAVGDIKETNPEWRAEKSRILKREWDYVFRRLFYATAPDLAKAPFGDAVEVDSVESTAGWMFNLDLLVDAAGRAHLLWVRRNIQYGFLRDRFFAGQPIFEEIRHAVIVGEKVVSVSTLWRQEVTADAGAGAVGRLHLLPDGRLHAVLGLPGESGLELWLQEIAAGGAPRRRVALARPLPAGFFFTNTPRGGSPPDHDLHLLAIEPGRDGYGFRHLHVHVP